jgi:hypothetical protein
MRGIAFLRNLCAALALGAACGVSGTVRADDIEVTEARLTSTDEGVVLAADFAFELNPRLVEVATNGVPLYFAVEFELTRPRWYWFDEKTAVKRLQIRLSYHALSRQYRLSTGVLQQSFPSLEEALHVLRRVRNWLVVERGTGLSEATYEAAVRMRLDVALLPKPFQLSAITNRELNLESPWRRFAFRVAAATPSTPPAPAAPAAPAAPTASPPAPVETRDRREVENR